MRARVLIVDDTLFMRRQLSKMLTDNGYDIAGEASNGEEAFLKYVETKPDVVTMDITMPGVDGIQGVKNIRKSDPKAKIIMCTALGQQSMVLEAIQSGAADYIIKPFQVERVLEALKRVLGNQQV